VEQFEAISRDHALERLSIRRARAARHGAHRRTVRQALESPVLPPKRPPFLNADVERYTTIDWSGLAAQDLFS
jgi:hypothetical protein